MNVFDVLREKINEKAFERYGNEGMGGQMVVTLDDINETINQVEQFCKETLNLNIDDKKPTATELVEHLHMHMDLFTFDPSTGNDLEPYQMNELNRDLYTTMYYAKQFLESNPKTNADRIRSMSDEELADTLLKINEINDHIPFCGSLPECDEILDKGELIPEGMRKRCLMNWLGKEVSD